MSDTNERSVASAGSVSAEPVAWAIQWSHAQGVSFDRLYETREDAEMLLASMPDFLVGEAVPLYCQPQQSLTDAERMAIKEAMEGYGEWMDDDGVLHQEAASTVATLRGLLERTK